MHRALLATIFLTGSAMAAEEPTDPVAASRAFYATGLRADEQAFDEALRSLNGRFKTALEKLQLDARGQGNLDETLAAKQLWDRIVPLSTAAVFGALGPLSGPVTMPPPPPPPGRGLTAQAYTNYASKVFALSGHFNAASSNRHARYLAALDRVVVDLTKQSNLDAAVRARDQRMSAAKAGPVRLVAAERTTPFGGSRQRAPPAFAGLWRFTGPFPQPSREFGGDGLLYEHGGGGVEFTFPYRVMEPSTIVAEGLGWVRTFRAMPDGTLVLDALRQANGEVVRFLGRRDGGE